MCSTGDRRRLGGTSPNTSLQILGGTSAFAAYGPGPVSISGPALARRLLFRAAKDENANMNRSRSRESSDSDETEYTSATEVRDEASTCTVRKLPL
jgi:hypothetical protein